MDDVLHWSFSDGPNLAGKVFPEGFSAAASTLPDDDFDPTQAWEHAYDVVYPGPPKFEEDHRVYYGSLRIAATPDGDQLRLRVRGVRQLQQHFRWERQHLEAEMTCGDGPLRPLADGAEWRLRLRLKNQADPATKPFAPLDEVGRLRGTRIEKRTVDGNWRLYREAPEGMPVVCDWALLAAVQSLPREGDGHAFVQLQQLERSFPDQRLRFMETFDARFGERDVRLHGFVHTGEGMIPSYYWVDDRGRLLIARYALSMLVYNAHPRLEKEAQNDV